LEQGHPQEAGVEFRAALSVQPGFADAHFGLAKALLQQDQPAEALSQVEQSIEIDPGKEQAHFLRYQILRKLQREADAATELAKFKELKSRSLPVSDRESNPQ
jgi:tetratricopeptide (TPR) repeat protein